MKIKTDERSWMDLLVLQKSYIWSADTLCKVVLSVKQFCTWLLWNDKYLLTVFCTNSFLVQFSRSSIPENYWYLKMFMLIHSKHSTVNTYLLVMYILPSVPFITNATHCRNIRNIIQWPEWLISLYLVISKN